MIFQNIFIHLKIKYFILFQKSILLIDFILF